jgi:hypothetical protein
MNVIAIEEPDFHRLSFASQMIVWATRKRLHLLANGDSEVHVTEAFAKGGLTELHTALMSIVDVLLCGSSRRIQLHAVSCPCLSPHEVSLLNALSLRQLGRIDDSRAALGELFCRAALGLVEPAVESMVAELDARGLRLTTIEANGDAPAARSGARSPSWSKPRNATVH